MPTLWELLQQYIEYRKIRYSGDFFAALEPPVPFDVVMHLREPGF